ncbi:MAG TPA: PilZ domain-containing protein [Nannocystaceae bacterium]|nr:PilZ domain-containing protein [Nannocystaceae bacterium]
MSGDDGNERRRAERVPINSEFSRMPAPMFVSDLSEGGVFVHTTQRVPIGSEVTVRFTVLLDDPVVIEAKGRVVRHQLDPAGIGIAFTQLNPDMALRIDDVLTRERPRDLGPPISGSPAAAARRRTTAPPQTPPSSGDTRIVRAPYGVGGTQVAPPPAAPEDEDDGYKTQVKLRAVDVEILDEESELDEDAPERDP